MFGDIHGNVKTLIQDNKKLAGIADISNNRFKRMDYTYDLISGNVHRVDYQTGMKDEWHHAYFYDADNRIRDVYTTASTPMAVPHITGMISSQNEMELSPYWDKEATYIYYDHGPLARVELGEEAVQGIDYYYTLQGWIKGVNSSVLKETSDPGRDGWQNVNSSNAHVGRDAYGYTLSYFAGDYSSISGDMAMFPTGTATVNGVNLYNGNIGRMTTTITDPTTREVMPLVNKYAYDQLNRLVESRSYKAIDVSANTWQAPGSALYRNAFTYDANGNILTQSRANATGVVFDSLTYRYHLNQAGKTIRNRLYHVDDALTDQTPNELTDQGTFAPGSINLTSNYRYDEEGRLVADAAEGISKIVWRVDGKVKEIQRPVNSGKKNLRFEYDAMGHRIAKHVYDDNWHLQASTYYTLDAQGNVMSVYERKVDDVNSVVSFKLKEQYIYGSSRTGVRNTNVNLLSTSMTLPVSAYSAHDIGKKTFELTNHLGNVLSTISDKPIPHTNGTTVDYFLADIRTASDYYPFGASMRERSFTLVGAEEFRFGFQSQERDNDISGVGNSYTAEFWQYDSRLGRRWNIDPVIKHHESPYAGFANNPILFVDPDGADTLRVVSKALNDKGEKWKEGDNRMFLFTAYSKDDRKGEILSSEFQQKYQMLAEQVSCNIDGASSMTRTYARFLYANQDELNLSLAVAVIGLADLRYMGQKAYNEIGTDGISAYEKFTRFNHGEEYDFKSTFADNKPYTYVKGVGMFESDHIGNIIYGSVMAQSGASVKESLYDGDFLTRGKSVDDPYDSYAIALGHFHGRKGITKVTLTVNNMNFMKMVKTTMYSNGNSREPSINETLHFNYRIHTNGQTHEYSFSLTD